MAFKKKISIVRYYIFSLLDTLNFDQPMLFFLNILMDFHLHGIQL